MLECQTCKLIVKRKDALSGLYPICPIPHPKGGNLYKFTDEVVYGKCGKMNEKEQDKKCKYGKGEQDMTSCPYIYIHWPGYYPTKERYEHAIKNLCQNYVSNKIKNEK